MLYFMYINITGLQLKNHYKKAGWHGSVVESRLISQKVMVRAHVWVEGLIPSVVLAGDS